jgi:dTMP kinase
MSHGLFLALDGIDGGGKSTQCRLLADWLRSRGHTVITCIEPGSTPLGVQVRDIVLHQRSELCLTSEALLFLAARAQLVGSVIRPNLEAGHTVLSDRFLLSTVVYQGHAGGLDPGQLWQVGLWSTGGLEPDLTLVLDLAPEVAATRRQRPVDRIESRGEAFHTRVRQGFLNEAARRPERIQLVEATQPIGVVQAQICSAVARLEARRATTGGKEV